MLTAIGGGLLLFGAAQHLLAKTMSLIVGVAFGAAAIIAAVSGDVLGLAAANGWTEIGWGIAAAILLFNTLIPRRRTTVVTEPGYAAGARTGDGVGSRRVGTGAVVGTGAAAGVVAEHERHRERVDERVDERGDEGERASTNATAAERAGHRERVAERDGVAEPQTEPLRPGSVR